MAEVIVDKAVCSSCGVDVREETVFCYNCGSRVAHDSTAAKNGAPTNVGHDTRAALDDLAERLKQGEAEQGDRLAKAAEQRRKARVSRRKTHKIVWEPTGDSSQMFIVGFAVAVAIIALIAVLLTVVWK
jgi:predicted amidophosphoribosyltransferase